VKLENPPQPEQYDPAAEQPVREMAILLGGVLVISLALALVLAYFAGMLAPRACRLRWSATSWPRE
jgi:hypothetical protein